MTKKNNDNEEMLKDGITSILRGLGIDPAAEEVEVTVDGDDEGHISLETLIKDILNQPSDTCDDMNEDESPDCEHCDDRMMCKAIDALRAVGFDDGDIASMLGIEPDGDDEPDGELDEFYVPVEWKMLGFIKMRAHSFDEACDIVDDHVCINGRFDNDAAHAVPPSLKANREPMLAKLAEMAGLPTIDESKPE